jgi:iron-sulfur cluster repair protein YtfE (RIC family)
MLREHGKINSLLIEYERDPNLKKFNDFKWILEKHLFVEEKVIFEIYNNSSDQEIGELNQLVKEHKDMLWLLSGIEDNEENSSRISILKKILPAHARFEDEIFYPRLDEELDEEKKKLIIERCSEIFRE